jgi:hypothetical protein
MINTDLTKKIDFSPSGVNCMPALFFTRQLFCLGEWKIYEARDFVKSHYTPAALE